MKAILATLTNVLGLLSVVPAMAADEIDTSNQSQRKQVFDRLGNDGG